MDWFFAASTAPNRLDVMSNGIKQIASWFHVNVLIRHWLINV